uniref:Group II intron maturase-specific domain-containing protein n=1 Tax=Boodleopsis sp. FL1161 TaxID=2364084 RepID=A0A386AZ55_9CHLO|nr:hypothetical protein [Boodleopsis sp. FL1161]
MKKNNLINWNFIFRKIKNIQKRIKKNKNNYRRCRNLQRLMLKTRFIQLLVIKQIYKQNSFLFIEITNQHFLLKKKIQYRLWILALSPLYTNSNFLDIKDKKIYFKFCNFFKNPTTNYISVNYFSNFLNKKSKKWLLTNLFIEKKFFINWIIEIDYLSSEYTLLRKIIKNLFFLQFISFFNKTQEILYLKKEYIYQKNQSLNFIEYNGFFLIAFKNKKNLLVFQKYLFYFVQNHGLSLKYEKVCSLTQGLDFSGWIFQKKNNNFSAVISPKNLYNHQRQIRRYLKHPSLKNKSVDQVIFELNQKIISWQKFYSCSMKYSQTCSIMNKFLFRQIWVWIKKRSKNRNSRWLFERYWKQSKTKNWTFSLNDETLIFYKKKI